MMKQNIQHLRRWRLQISLIVDRKFLFQPLQHLVTYRFLPSHLFYSFYLPVVLIVMSSVQQQKKLLEQLRREASVKRIPVSSAIEDMKVGV